MRIISSYTIISDIYRDLDITYTDWENDALEWIGRAVKRINSPKVLHKGIIEEKVVDFRWKIDSCLEAIRLIEYKNQKLSKGSSVGHYTTGNKVKTSVQQEIRLTRDFYVENFDYLNFSFEKGDIKVHGSWLPVDEKGYPLIPTVEEYRDYLNYYILEKLLLKGWKHPDPQVTYTNIEFKNRTIYRPKAVNSMRRISVEDMERLMPMFMSYRPMLYSADNLFINNEIKPFSINEI